MAIPILGILDRSIFTATSGGTASFVVSAAVAGYQTPSAAGAVDGQQYAYAAQSSDLSQWEYGYGTWTAASSTLTRTVVGNSLGNTSAVNFSAAPQVLMTVLGESIVPYSNGQANLALGTITANAKALNITGTWNNAATTFDAPLFMNITNTASASGSRVFDFQIGGSSFFYTGSPDGNLVINQLTSAVSGNMLSLNYAGNPQFVFGSGATANSAVLTINNSSTNYAISFGQAKSALNFGGGAAVLQDEASGVLAMRSATTAHTLRVYNTSDSGLALPTNYERGVFDWTTTANVLTIGTQAGGTGTKRAVVVSSAFANGYAVTIDASVGSAAYIKLAASSGIDLAVGGGLGARYSGDWNFAGPKLAWTGGGTVTVGNDVSLGRASAGVLQIGDGGANANGSLNLTTLNAALGTITANAKALNITTTWNNSGVTFDAPLFMNITNTASATGSLLMDFQIGSTTVLGYQIGGSFHGVTVSAAGGLVLWPAAGTAVPLIMVPSENSFGPGFKAGGNDMCFDSAVNFVSRIGIGPSYQSRQFQVAIENTNNIGLNNTTTASGWRVYNTTDAQFGGSPTNYERGVFDWTTTANVLTIGMQKGGTGSGRDIAYVVAANANAHYFMNPAASNSTVAIIGRDNNTGQEGVYLSGSNSGIGPSGINWVDFNSGLPTPGGSGITSIITTSIGQAANGVIQIGRTPNASSSQFFTYGITAQPNTGTNIAGSSFTETASLSTGGGAYGNWVLQTGFTGTGAAGTCTISNASPAVITIAAHNFFIGEPVLFSTTGSLPTGLSTLTTYYTISAGFAAGAFEVSTSFGGSAVNTSSAGSGTQTVSPGGVCTISNASPAVITLNNHGLVPGMVVQFSANGGTLPTGLSAATNYFVISAGLGLNTFEVSATLNGSAVNTSSAGSGTFTALYQGGTVQNPAYTVATWGPSQLTGQLTTPALAISQTWNTTGVANGVQLNLTAINAAAGSSLLTLSLGSVASNIRALNITGNWTNGSLAYDAPLFMNITGSASGSAAFFDFQFNSNSILSLLPNYSTSGLTGGAIFTYSGAGMFSAVGAPGALFFADAGNILASAIGAEGFGLGLGGKLKFFNGVPSGWVSTADLALFREAASILGIQNPASTTTATGFHVYNTTDAGITNYERGVFDWTTTANTLTIGVQAGGTGNTNRNLRFTLGGGEIDWFSNGSPVWSFNAALSNIWVWANTQLIGWTPGSSQGAGDIYLSRAAANTFQIGTQAQSGDYTIGNVAATTGLNIQGSGTGNTNGAGSTFNLRTSISTGGGLAGIWNINTGFQGTGAAGTCTISNASPAVITIASHNFFVGEPVLFSTTGSLPTGLSTLTTYYIISAGFGTGAFEVSTSFGGSAVNTSSAGSGTQTVSPGGVCTISNASPAVITLNNHGLVPGMQVQFATTGSLPTGLSTSTNYFVLASGLTVNAFQVSATLNGSAINTSSAGSGTQTVLYQGGTLQNPAYTVATWGPSQLTGTQTTSALSIAQTWNTSGVVDAALKVNVTNVNSATNSLLMDLQANAGTVLSVAAKGGGSGNGITWNNGIGTLNIYESSGFNDIFANQSGGANVTFGFGVNQFYVSATSNPGVGSAFFTVKNTAVIVGQSCSYGFSSFAGNSLDSKLYRDAAAGLFAFSPSSAGAAAVRVYNTTDQIGTGTAPTNYERGVFDWTTTANTLTIGTIAGGTGTQRPLTLTVGSGGGNQNFITLTPAQGVVYSSQTTHAFQFNGGASVDINNTGILRFTPSGVVRVGIGSAGSVPVLAISDGGTNTNGWLNWAGEARLDADFSKTSSAVLANVTGTSHNLSVSLQAGRTYIFEAVLFCTSGTTGGIQVALGGTATVTSLIADANVMDSTTNVATTRVTALASTLVNAAMTTGTQIKVYINGVITVNAAGTFTIQFAQHASNATASVVKAGSYMLVQDTP